MTKEPKVAKPTSTGTLKTRLATLETELLELQNGAAELIGSTAAGKSADGLARVCREMRQTLQTAREQGHIANL